MTDATLNRFLAHGTAADRASFVPDPPTPASGPDPLYVWKESDTGDVYFSDGSTSAKVGAARSTLPQGRLTLTTAVPVLTANVTGATTVYYTPFRGDQVPIYNGSVWALNTFTELSQATTDNTKSPAACVAHSNYDLFVWNDSGTLRCTRGPRWISTQTFTVTIATPAVVSATAHGLKEGMPWVPTTDGALPTGMTAGTTYFVIATGLTADAFQFSATLGGAAVNTSGSQSGTHTATTSNKIRGTGAGTTELTLLNGIYVNTNAITNGPAANRGTYVGTIRTNGSSQVDCYVGSTAADGGTAGFGVHIWNMYNRVLTIAESNDSTNSWNYTTLTWRAKNGTHSNRISYVQGIADSAVKFTGYASSSNASNQTRGTVASLDSASLATTGGSISWGGSNNTGWFPHTSIFHGYPGIGFHYFLQLEISIATGTTTWYGDNSTAGEKWSPSVLEIWA